MARGVTLPFYSRSVRLLSLTVRTSGFQMGCQLVAAFVKKV